MARRYRQQKRGEAAAQMRDRIVRATFELHAEQGLAATSMKQIAERAGVAVGSVYNHFPTYDEAIQACGAYAFSLAPSPSEALFEGAADRDERVRRLARAIFGQFDTLRAYGYVVAEQDRLPVLKPIVRQEAEQRLAMAAAAIGCAPDDERARTLAALLDHGCLAALKAMGFSAEAAAGRVAEMANTWLAARGA